MAENAGVYVILDMHGVPGGQSTDHCTGQRNQNKLWTSETCQQQMATLWTNIAQHFKGRSAIVAFDLMNEPYGDFNDDMRPNLKELMPKIYAAVRSADENRLVIFPNARGHGPSFYGDIKSAGLTNIGFTDHYYAGLFGSPPTVESHVKVFEHRIPETAEYLQSQQSADADRRIQRREHQGRRQADDAALLRRIRPPRVDVHDVELQDLKTTAGVQEDDWYMATNADALPAIDPKTSSLEDIRAYIKSVATMPLAVDESLRSAADIDGSAALFHSRNPNRTGHATRRQCASHNFKRDYRDQ